MSAAVVLQMFPDLMLISETLNSGLWTIPTGKSLIVQGDFQLQQEFSLIMNELIEGHTIHCYVFRYCNELIILR